MIGGFLGSGKTTSILKLAEWLRSQKSLRVGIITNDQANGLVDTRLSKAASFATSEISGGCFCCKSDALLRATDELANAVNPDVFLAEPVGSCTDLVATVSLPLLKIYGRQYDIAPMSVLVDPLRARRILQSNNLPVKDGSFSADVDYIYKKQLEEAEIIVINKTDIISKPRLDDLKGLMAETYPEAEVITISARTGGGLEPWFESILQRQLNVTRLMEVDYTRYGRGEAQLGWFNGSYSLAASDGRQWNGNTFLREFAGAIRSAFATEQVEVAHLKATLEDLAGEGEPGRLAAIQWVSSGSIPELSIEQHGDVFDGELTLNVRAEQAPEHIAATVARIFKQFDSLAITLKTVDHFRPSQPKPLHRVRELEGPASPA